MGSASSTLGVLSPHGECLLHMGNASSTRGVPLCRHSPYSGGTPLSVQALPIQWKHSPHCRGIFRHLSSDFLASTAPSVNIPCRCRTFHQLLSTFHASGGPSINFLFGHRSFRQHLSTFCLAVVSYTTSVNFQCIRWSLRQVPLPFRAKAGPSVNFRQLSVHLRDVPLTYVHFLCVVRLYVNFFQLSVYPWDLPSTFHAST